jgi:hypothetical protein
LFSGNWYPDDSYNPYDDAQHLFAAAIKPAPPRRAATFAANAGRSRSGATEV